MGKIVGNTVGIPNPKSDWNQTDETKADYIKNKPNLDNYSNALKGTANGRGAVRIDDISPVGHSLKLNISRVNLLSSPFGELDFLEQGKNYTLSAKIRNGIEDSKYWGIRWTGTYDGVEQEKDNIFFYSGSVTEREFTFTVGGEENTKDYYLDWDGLTEEDFEYCQLEEGIVATTYVPYIEDLNNVKFKSYGKNLDPYNPDKPKENWDLTSDDNSAWYALSVPCDATLSLYRDKRIGTFHLYDYDEKGAKVSSKAYFSENANSALKALIQLKGTHTYKIKTTKNAVNNYLPDNTNEKFFRFWLQVEAGSATEYEEYKEPVDGAVSVYPTTTLIADIPGTNIEVTYNKDINTVIKDINTVIAEMTATIISLGGNI